VAGKGGLSGVAVGFLALGGILAYAGFRGVSPVQALKDIGSGKPPAPTSNPTQLGGGGTAAGGDGGGSSGATGSVAAAAAPYMNDKYSQARREEPGYSDCSSFACKVLRGIGIPPPQKWANTTNFLVSNEWQTIPESQAKAGDIAIRVGHMAMLTSATEGIGQQNSRVNIRTGSLRSLMGPNYMIKTFVGGKRNKLQMGIR
jgi:hypothetical protein